MYVPGGSRGETQAIVTQLHRMVSRMNASKPRVSTWLGLGLGLGCGLGLG